jgi:hypothetical protein
MYFSILALHLEKKIKILLLHFKILKPHVSNFIVCKTCRNIHCGGIKIKNTIHIYFIFFIINKKIQNCRQTSFLKFVN